MSTDVAILQKALESSPHLVHAKNLLTQWSNVKEAKTPAEKKKRTGLAAVIARYGEYLTANLRVSGVDDSAIASRVDALNGYYNYLHDNGYDNLFSAQSKFRPTILEEFMAILFKDLVDAVQGKCPCEKLNFGAVKAYANLYFYGKDFRSFVAKPTIGLNLKDQDFAIYRNVELKVDEGESVTTSLPIVAVECKSYIDKTMLEGSVATAEKIKSGNPYALFCMVSEQYDVSMNVDPAYSRIDQIYILRKKTRREPWRDIDSKVVTAFVRQVENHLVRPWSDIAKKLSDTGTLI